MRDTAPDSSLHAIEMYMGLHRQAFTYFNPLTLSNFFPLYILKYNTLQSGDRISPRNIESYFNAYNGRELIKSMS